MTPGPQFCSPTQRVGCISRIDRGLGVEDGIAGVKMEGPGRARVGQMNKNLLKK